jgi:hypothetical protein
VSARADRLKRLAADIYKKSDEIGDKCEANYYRRKALKALPADERVDVNTYMSYIGSAKRTKAVKGQFRESYAIARDKGKV